MNTQLQTLKNDIKITAIQTRDLRNHARECFAKIRLTEKGTERDRLHQEAIQARRSIDYRQRERLLAYGYLRGRTYRQIEQKCRIAPSIQLIFEIAETERPIIEAWLITEGCRREWPEQVAT